MLNPDVLGKPWRQLFRSPSELEMIQPQFILDNLIPPGVTFLGGPPGHGKSWYALCLAKSIWSGHSFLCHDQFKCISSSPILYLSPEVNSTMFKKRLNLLGLGNLGPDSGFFCRTLTEGPFLRLGDPNLRAAVKDLQPVIVLDTLTRFNTAEDENNSSQVNRAVGDHFWDLQSIGAKAILAVHHSIKDLARSEVTPTLENVLRGSGDYGAMADAVYCIRSFDLVNFIAEVTCVKSRDFEAKPTFEFQGRPYIDQEGELRLIRPPEMDPMEYRDLKIKRVADFIRDNPNASHSEVAKQCGISKGAVQAYASSAGFMQNSKSHLWEDRPKN